MDFNCDYCGRAHGDSHIHDCGHSLCFTCSLEGCPKCEAEKQEAERLEAERTRINEVIECCICMDTIQITNRAVTECGHVFCLGCLLQHLRTKNDCPMCRREVGPPPSRRVLRLDDLLTDDTLFRRLISSIFRVSGQVPGHGHRHRREAQAQAPRRRNIRCGICRQPGHNRRTCRVAQANAQVHG